LPAGRRGAFGGKENGFYVTYYKEHATNEKIGILNE